MYQLKQINDHNVQWYNKIFPCVIGQNGLTCDKIEGDRKTPIGQFLMEAVYYRADRIRKPETILPTFVITPALGWSDDPTDPRYNNLIDLPYKYSHETLYRKDHLYDLMIVTSYNRKPSVSGKGSAIFIHSWQKLENNIPFTLGCLAMSLENLYIILKEVKQDSCWDTLPL